jgi:RNA methyltransferase, TrmH family
LEKIQGKDNSLIKYVKKLKDKKYRVKESAFIVEGFRFVDEALKSGFEVPYLFVSQSAADNGSYLNIANIINHDTKSYIVTDAVIKEISDTENPQGIVAVVKTDSYSFESYKDGFYVLVDKIQDPGNMGTIIRTSHAAGALGIIYTKGTVDVYNEKTLRSTMGSVFHIPIIEDNDLSILKALKLKGFKLIVSSLDTSKNFFQADLKGNLIICIGNEGNGVSDEIYTLSDEKVKIPMPGKAESLNASVAAGIMIYEIVRQNMLK